TAIDHEHLVRRDDGDDRGRGHPTHPMPTHPHLEEGRVARVLVRENPLDRATTATCEREADAVGEPVTGDGAGRVEPPALAQCNRHRCIGPRSPAMPNSPA